MMEIKTQGYTSKAYASVGSPFRHHMRVARARNPATGIREVVGWIAVTEVDLPLAQAEGENFFETLGGYSDAVAEHLPLAVMIEHHRDGRDRLPSLWGWSRPWGLVDSIVVRPGYRRRGVGARLLREVVDSELVHCQIVSVTPRILDRDYRESVMLGPDGEMFDFDTIIASGDSGPWPIEGLMEAQWGWERVEAPRPQTFRQGGFWWFNPNPMRRVEPSESSALESARWIDPKGSHERHRHRIATVHRVAEAIRLHVRIQMEERRRPWPEALAVRCSAWLQEADHGLAVPGTRCSGVERQVYGTAPDRADAVRPEHRKVVERTPIQTARDALEMRIQDWEARNRADEPIGVDSARRLAWWFVETFGDAAHGIAHDWLMAIWDHPQAARKYLEIH